MKNIGNIGIQKTSETPIIRKPWEYTEYNGNIMRT
jgi:hypothetical protein